MAHVGRKEVSLKLLKMIKLSEKDSTYVQQSNKVSFYHAISIISKVLVMAEADKGPLSSEKCSLFFLEFTDTSERDTC